MKIDKYERPAPRKPRQQRSLYKVELILEAAMRLIEKDGIAALTTNAVAATAGVSIGSLYQYFPHKEAILDAIGDREVASFGDRITAVVQARDNLAPEERVGAILRAIRDGYGSRGRVHREIMEYALGRASQRLDPFLQRIMQMMVSGDRGGPQGQANPIAPAEAFVALHAFVGVVRAMISLGDQNEPPQVEIEAAVARMLARFIGQDRIGA